jgi:hypothetical protein
MTSSTCGVFQAESVRGSRRGKLSVIVVLHNVVFYMLGSWITLGTYWLDNSGQWRIPFALQVSGLAQRCEIPTLITIYSWCLQLFSSSFCNWYQNLRDGYCSRTAMRKLLSPCGGTSERVFDSTTTSSKMSTSPSKVLFRLKGCLRFLSKRSYSVEIVQAISSGCFWVWALSSCR